LDPFQALKINLLPSPIQMALQLGSPVPFAWTSFLLNCTNDAGKEWTE
jgi:hypothetical protein